MIVIGLGGIGSATLYELAKRGLRVLGIEQYQIGHDRGSSHGETRIYRQAYFEHPDYVPLLKRAYQQWHDLNVTCKQRLFHEVGLIEVGPPDGIVIPGVRKSVERHGLDIRELDDHQFKDEFPQFRKQEGSVALFEPTAGYLLVEECVRQQIRLAKQRGAVVLAGTTVQSVSTRSSSADSDCLVMTNNDTFSSKSLVVTVGAWISKLLEMPVVFRLFRKHLDWYQCDDQRYFATSNCPAFFFEEANSYFYGFPAINHRIKVAEHGGGEVIADPDDLSRVPDDQNTERVNRFVDSHLPGVAMKQLAHDTCMYTLSPDEHFIIDRLGPNKNIAVAAGLSGHGFKFAPALAEVLAEILIDGNSSLPIDFLSLRRFG